MGAREQRSDEPGSSAKSPKPRRKRRPQDPAELEQARIDAELMTRFKKGDAAAFEALLKRHKKSVYNFCLRFLGDRHRAEDAVQEIFLRVVKSAKSWEKQTKFTSWLFTIARNYCVDQHRRQQHRQTASLDQTLGSKKDDGATLQDLIADGGIAPDRAAEHLRIRNVLRAAIELLPEEQREVFLMREYAGMRFRDIAEVTNTSENTAKSRMRYALETLRARLAEAGFDRVLKEEAG